jgi:hypothetical protein
MSAYVQLFVIADQPGRVAATKAGACVDGGAFFLDFCRPLVTHRWFLVRNTKIGPVGMLTVPVVHQCEPVGRFVIAMQRSDPNFKNVLALWKERYPSSPAPAGTGRAGLEIAADWGAQFPDGC